MIKQLRLLLEKIRPANQLERIITLEEPLRALLRLIRLAQDLRRVELQRLVPRPRTIPHISLDQLPIPPIIARKVRFRMAVCP